MQQGISCYWLFEICKEIRTERNSHANVQRHCRATFSLLLFSVGSCCETRLKALEKLQNRAARIVSNSSYDTSATLLIKNLKWLTVTDMIKSETATMTYKAITGLTPSYLANLFTKNTDRNILCCDNSDILSWC